MGTHTKNPRNVALGYLAWYSRYVFAIAHGNSSCLRVGNKAGAVMLRVARLETGRDKALVSDWKHEVGVMSKAYDMELARLKEWESMKAQMKREGSIILFDEHDRPTRSGGKTKEMLHEAGK